MIRPARLAPSLFAAALFFGCDQGSEAPAAAAPDDAPPSVRVATDGAPPPDAEPAPSGVETLAYLHADLWSTFWNDRARCGAERTFLHICENRPGADCDPYRKAVAACDPTKIVYGQVGPEKQSEELCRRGPFPDIGGCVASRFDFEKLRFSWYGAEWQGNWPFATLKVFPKGADWRKSGDIVALSTLPGLRQSAMEGVRNHGLGFGCTMHGVTTGDDKYRRPFGAFAWVAVPAGQPLTIAGVSGTNFHDEGFSGCRRGAATQTPWVTSPPGAELGCAYVLTDVTFTAGRHYVFRYGRLEELASSGPPPEIVAGFALPGVAIDVTSRKSCRLD